jgi:hypothetical protein
MTTMPSNLDISRRNAPTRPRRGTLCFLLAGRQLLCTHKPTRQRTVQMDVQGQRFRDAATQRTPPTIDASVRNDRRDLEACGVGTSSRRT